MPIALTDNRLNLAATATFAGSPGITHVQLHTGAPGGSGTDNIAAGVARASLSIGAASGGAVALSATFTIPAAGGPYTHISFWSAASGGTFCGTDGPSPTVSFGNPGTLTYTATYAG